MIRTVVKLGGSLLDLPDLTCRLSAFLDTLRPASCVLVVGGGADVDRLRERERLGCLTAERAHWLAIRVMSLNTRVIAAHLGSTVVTRTKRFQREAESGRTIAIDAYAWLRDEERRDQTPLPRSWAVTSDSIAAHLAHRLGAAKLVLLKSRGFAVSDSLTTPVEWKGWHAHACTRGYVRSRNGEIRKKPSLQEAVSAGLVDQTFPARAAGLAVSLFNFRSDPPVESCRWSASRAPEVPSFAQGPGR